ncbi:MAG: nucleotidyltransferase domain-containing protein [Bacteroidota bacterium]|nr:nucleotidyltransferase domain-containing protein [Bacteroidota bacterium]
MTKHIILEKLRQIKPQLHKDFSVTELALFGSYARNEQTPQSDIDVLIKLDESTYKNLCNTAYALYELFPDHKVEIVSIDAINTRYFTYVKPDLQYV